MLDAMVFVAILGEYEAGYEGGSEDRIEDWELVQYMEQTGLSAFLNRKTLYRGDI